MRKFFIHILLIVAFIGVKSCSLKENYNPTESVNNTIEFVGRPAGFNNVDVLTKSAPDPDKAFETAIYTAYLLVFDADGNRVHFSEVDGTNLVGRVSVKGLTTVTACLIANVTKSFAEGLDTYAKVTNAVIDGITYATGEEAGGHLGVPKLTVDGETKYCFPMFGSTTLDVSQRLQIQIPIRRLFAKVSVKLALDVNLSGLQNAIQTYTHYQLEHWRLYNIPNKVRLVENTSIESEWKNGEGNDNAIKGIYLQSENLDVNIYNKSSSTNQSKLYEFDFYVPEFYMNSIENPINDQRHKPKNYPDGNYPIFIELVGEYNEYSITSTDIFYKIYLGGDHISNYSLARNTHYINNLTIKGTSQNNTTEGSNIDHRVTTTTINNPVAKEGKSANCYVINKTGEYFFPAYKGAYNDLSKAVLCDNTTAKDLVILANSNSSNIELTDYSYDKEKNIVSFNVNKMANGNVVIGLMNTDGTLEWSWHLWFNSESRIGLEGWGEFTSQTMPDGQNEMMDRNVGSNPSAQAWFAGAASGTYYMYGNRAPYFTDNRTNGNGSNYHGYTKDDTQTWNTSEKSPTDPCPPGYRVPSASVWNGNATKEHASVSILGMGYTAFRYWNNGTSGITNTDDDIYYPYSGYINENITSPDIVTSENDNTSMTYHADDYSPLGAFTETLTTNTVQIGDITNESSLNQKRTIGYTEHKYSDFKYSTILTSNALGYLWSCNDYCYQYKSKVNNWESYNITECKEQIRQSTRTQRRIRVYIPFVGYTEYGDWVDITDVE